MIVSSISLNSKFILFPLFKKLKCRWGFFKNYRAHKENAIIQ